MGQRSSKKKAKSQSSPEESITATETGTIAEYYRALNKEKVRIQESWQDRKGDTDRESFKTSEDGVPQNNLSGSMVNDDETINKLCSRIIDYTVEQLKPRNTSSVSLEVRVNSAAAIEDLDSFQTSENEQCIAEEESKRQNEELTTSQLSIGGGSKSSSAKWSCKHSKDENDYRLHSSNDDGKMGAEEARQKKKEKKAKAKAKAKAKKAEDAKACRVNQSSASMVSTAGNISVKPCVEQVMENVQPCVEQVIEDVSDCIEGFKEWASPPKRVPVSRKKLFRTRTTPLPRPVSPEEQKWTLVNECKPVTVQPVNKATTLDSPQKGNTQLQIMDKCHCPSDSVKNEICNAKGDAYLENPQSSVKEVGQKQKSLCISSESFTIVHPEGGIHQKNSQSRPKKVVQPQTDKNTFSSFENFPIVHDYIDRGEKGKRGPVPKKRINSKKTVHPKHQSQKKNKRTSDEGFPSVTAREGCEVVPAAGSTRIVNNPFIKHASMTKAFRIKKRQ